MNLRSQFSRTVRAVAADARRAPFVPPGHYYSPIPAPADVERAIRYRRPPAAVDLHEAEQLSLAKGLNLRQPAEGRWTADPSNTMFGAADAALFEALLLERRPERIVEIGSGYSTALALDVAERALPELRIHCVEPHADRLRSRLRPGDADRLTLLERPVQDVAPEDLIKDLGPGDIFFIDSTHVVKAGSDVVWLLLYTLPLLPQGVLVHVHDIHWPFEYPDHWLRAGRAWTEAYFMHAFLAHNDAWRILLWGDWLAAQHPELLPDGLRDVRSGSLWLERVNS